MHHGVTRSLGGKHCTGVKVKCNPHGVDIPFFNFFVISLPFVQTRVFRPSPQCFHQTMQIGGHCIPRGSPPYIFAPPHKIPPKPHFEVPFNTKLLQTELSIIFSPNDVDRRSLHSQAGSHQISQPFPQKPHFGRPFNAKTIIERVLRQSRVNGATKLKIYCYIDIGKYLCVCQIYFRQGASAGAGPPNVNLGPP